MKIVSWITAIAIGLMAVHPLINYTIPLIVNSHHWLFLVITAGLFGMLLLFTDLHIFIKILSVYLLAGCFISHVPYMSFNAYILVIATLYFFLLVKKCDFKKILLVIEAVFWLEVLISVMQFFGRDTLMCFDRPERVFLGTVMQYMRFSTLFALLAPLLVLKNKWYIVPVVILVLVSTSLAFAFSIAGGILVYFWLSQKDIRLHILIAVFIFLGICIFQSYGHLVTETYEGRLPIWGIILKTWVFDTRLAFPPKPLIGPFHWKWLLFGHGMDTFLPLFPMFKHDPNPFPQAHNDWLQLAWETGLVGFSLFSFYCVWILNRLYKKREYLLIAGLAVISIQMFFSFPWRMTQTVLLMVVFVAFCERPHLRENNGLNTN